MSAGGDGGDGGLFEPRPMLFPAIDLRGGRVVRLVRGAGDAEIGYEDTPVTAARRWRDAGAECLHVIDLGAAFGEPDSAADILEIAAGLDVPVQTGGGIRDRARIAQLLGGGVARVILGTRGLADESFLAACVEEFGPGRIVLAMDIAGDRVRVSGWTEESSLDLAGGIEHARRCGVRHLLVTAIDRDGTLSGPRGELIERALELAGAQGMLVVAAGGIGSVADIRSVLELGGPALEGVVVGRALYEGSVDLEQALDVVDGFRNAAGTP